MDFSELEALYYITPLSNVPSILSEGILCHELAQNLASEPSSFANPDIREQRDKPVFLFKGGKREAGPNLHKYANLYLNPRNAMMFKLQDRHEEACVLSVDKTVLNQKGAILTDRNAASFANFYEAPEGLSHIDYETVFSRDWWDGQGGVNDTKKKRMMAEALIPKKIHPTNVQMGYVCCNRGLSTAEALGTDLDFKIKGKFFFNEGSGCHN